VKRLEMKIGAEGTLMRSSRSLKKKIDAEVKIGTELSEGEGRAEEFGKCQSEKRKVSEN
jgi:hypothetical protein